MKLTRKLWWLLIIGLLATGAIGWTIYAMMILAEGQQ